MGLIDLGLGGEKGVVGSVVDGGARVVEARELTRQEQARERSWAAVAAAKWRPALAEAIKSGLTLYVIGYLVMMVLDAWGMVTNAQWAYRHLDDNGEKLDAPIDALWSHYRALGERLFTFAALFLTTYGGGRSLEKVASALGAGSPVGGVLGRVGRAITGGESPAVVRAEVEVPAGRIERRPNVAWSGAATPTAAGPRPLDLSQLDAEIKAEEGYRDHIYLDSLGHPTHSWGALVQPGEPEFGQSVGTPVSLARGIECFEQDLSGAIRDARTVVRGFDDLPHDARLVLVSMAYQLGGAGLAKFKRMLDAIERRDWMAAAAEARDSRAYQQTPNRWERNAQRFEALATPPAYA